MEQISGLGGNLAIFTLLADLSDWKQILLGGYKV